MSDCDECEHKNCDQCGDDLSSEINDLDIDEYLTLKTKAGKFDESREVIKDMLEAQIVGKDHKFKARCDCFRCRAMELIK